MALLKIARMGHPVLTTPAAPIEDPTAEPVRRLAAHMAETMADAEGIGLAAPQVHQSLRLILFLPLDARDDTPPPAPLALVNPEVEALGEERVDGLEGCLSIPGLRGVVSRFARIGYRGLTLEGRTVEREAEGLHARVVQHEVDHLNGILYPMRMEDLRTLAFESELKHLVGDGPGGDEDEEGSAGR